MSSGSRPTVRYVAGGPVQVSDGVYVERAADTALLRSCRDGCYSIVLSSRQMGKSSLMYRTAERLVSEGIKPVIIDLQAFGANTTAEQWYRGVLEKIAEDLKLRGSVGDWWADGKQLSEAQRLNRFLMDVVLREVSEPIVVFVDEIDTTLQLAFTDDFFTSIRYLYSARPTNPALSRLSFVLLGVASTGDLVKDPKRTPFNVGERIDLSDFTEEEAARDLNADRGVLRAVFEYTNGHPYLTLRVFRSLAEQQLESNIEGRLESLFYGQQAEKDSNLAFVRDMLTKLAPDRESVLLRYRRIWKGMQVPDQETDPVCAWLRLSGVVRPENGFLKVRNPIYRRVFDEAWVRKNRTVNWARRAVWGAAVTLGVLTLIAAGLAPFAYRQRNEALAAQAKEAEARKNEQRQREKAESAAGLEATARREAVNQRRAAQESAKLAQVAEASARQNWRVASARGLTAQSLLVRAQNPNRIGTYLLLALESYHQEPFLEALQAVAEDLPLLRRSKMRLAHQDEVLCVAFSPDDRLLATGSADRAARVFESATGKELARLSHQGDVRSVAFSPDGRFIATGSNDGAARVFEIGTGKEVVNVPHQAQVNSVMFSPDGRLLATGGADKLARVLDRFTGKELVHVVHGSTVNSVAFSPDGRSIVTGDDTGARVFESNTAKEILKFSHQGQVNAVTFSPDGLLVAIGCADKARVFEIGTGKEAISLPPQTQVNSVVFSSDGQLMATGSGDTTARVFERKTGKELARIANSGEVTSAAFSRDGRLLATGGGDTGAQIYESETGRGVTRLTTEGPVRHLAFSGNGQRIAMSGLNNRIQAFEISTGKELSHSNPPLTQIDNPYQVVRIDPTQTVYSVDFSRDGYLTATILDTRIGRVFELFAQQFTQEEAVRLDLPVGALSMEFSRDRRLLATGGMDRTARIFQTGSGKEVARIPHQNFVSAVAFSPDGQLLATGDEKMARVFETGDGREVLRFVHSDSVLSVAFSPDGRLLATGGRDKTARVFERKTGKELARLTQEDAVSSVAFSRDGHLLGLASGKTVLVTPWVPEDLVKYACAHLNSNLDPDEWKQYLLEERYRRTCPDLANGVRGLIRLKPPVVMPPTNLSVTVR